MPDKDLLQHNVSICFTFPCAYPPVYYNIDNGIFP